MRTYNGPEHESFRAAARSMTVNYGPLFANLRIDGLLHFFGVRHASHLSPWGANRARKMLQEQLPIRGDYA